MRTVWKVHVKQGGYYLITAKTEAAAKERAKELGASKITKVEHHIPRPWPDPETLQVRTRQQEAAKESWNTRRERGLVAPSTR